MLESQAFFRALQQLMTLGLMHKTEAFAKIKTQN